MSTKSSRRSTFIWQISIDATEESAWKTAGMGTKASLLLDGLISGTRYYFRVAVVDKNGQHPWSNVLSLIVT